jgi:hypothetical protein
VPIGCEAGTKPPRLNKIGIASGLCWQLSEDSEGLGTRERRLRFHTWSWTSIEGEIRYKLY